MEQKTKPTGFGDSALALDVMLQLLIDLVCQRDPEFKDALIQAIDELFKSDAQPRDGVLISKEEHYFFCLADFSSLENTSGLASFRNISRAFGISLLDNQPETDGGLMSHNLAVA